MNRYLATALSPLLDIALFCVLIAAGLSLRSSHIVSFCAAMMLNYLLKVRSALIAEKLTRDWRAHVRILAIAAMALFLRGGMLGLLSTAWGWPVQVSIVFAVIAGMAVTTLGFAPARSSVRAVRPHALAAGMVLYAVALRLVYLGSVELLPEEAYYWNYARHLDIGYLDHPPMVAWLIRLGTAVFGQTEFGIRIGALSCAMIAGAFTYRLSRNLYGEVIAPAALVLGQVLPFFFLSGLLMTPDAALTAAWAASLYYLERALVAGRPVAWWGVGISLGIGMISKYSIGLLVPVTLAFMLWDAPSRRWWGRWRPYGAALLTLAIFSPVILWNAQHDWASFAFQTSRRLAEAPRFALHKLLASMLVLITPMGVLALAVAFRRSQPAGGVDGGGGGDRLARQRRFIAVAVFLPLTVFAIFSLRHEVKLDWTGAPLTAALPVMALGMSATAVYAGAIRAWLRNAWVPTLITLLLIYGAGLHYLVLGLPGLGYGKHNELVPVGWRDFTRRIGAIADKTRAETGREPLIVGMDRYAIASELAFYLTKRADTVVETSSAHLFEGVGLMYERWTPAEQQQGRTLLLVAWDPGDLAGKAIESRTERLGPIEDEILTHDGQVVRHYYHRLAYNYHSIPR
ncbi:MAG: glycosyltransferase family 39 protein [Gammaproteobacteria bacterium]